MNSPALMVGKVVGDLFGEVGGVGLDLVDVQLVADLIDDGGQPFLDACWTAAEQAVCQDDPERLAGRWAAKEAVMKCLGAGIGEIEPTDIEIVTLPSGAPAVVLRARAAAIARARRLAGCHVSLSHEKGWAAAVAVAQGLTTLPSADPSLAASTAGDLDV